MCLIVRQFIFVICEVVFENNAESFEIIKKTFEKCGNIFVKTVRNVLLDGLKYTFGRFKIFFGRSETRELSLISKIFSHFSKINNVITKIYSFLFSNSYEYKT